MIFFAYIAPALITHNIRFSVSNWLTELSPLADITSNGRSFVDGGACLFDKSIMFAHNASTNVFLKMNETATMRIRPITETANIVDDIADPLVTGWSWVAGVFCYEVTTVAPSHSASLNVDSDEAKEQVLQTNMKVQENISRKCLIIQTYYRYWNLFQLIPFISFKSQLHFCCLQHYI